VPATGGQTVTRSRPQSQVKGLPLQLKPERSAEVEGQEGTIDIAVKSRNYSCCAAIGELAVP